MRFRVTDRIGVKDFPYRHRRLKAGDEFEAAIGHESALRQLPFMEEVQAVAPQTYSTRAMAAEETAAPAPSPAPAPKRRGRPPGSRNQPRADAGSGKAAKRQAAATKADDQPAPLEDKTVPELREIAEEQGVELPGGYVKREDLVDQIEEARETEQQQPQEEEDKSQSKQNDDWGRF